ncbi:MAG: hypothetical protein WC314_20095 [Vulcanimicrobiota bacterium]
MTQSEAEKADFVLNFLGELLEQAERARINMRRTLAPFKLSLRQVLFLKKLEGEGKGVAELAAEYRLSSSEARDLCQWYANAGYLEFVGMPYRGYRLTALGRRVLDSKWVEIERLRQSVMDRVSPLNVESVAGLLRDLNEGFFQGLD